MNTTLDDIKAREQQHVLQTYRRQNVAFVRGEGAHIFDDAGRSYLDLVSGIGVTSLGHAHPGLTAVITDQAAKLLHTSNLYYHPFQAEAAARLSALSGLQRAFFCNSGTEANEACLKFARRFWYTQGATDRVGYVALQNGFAGRTMGRSVGHLGRALPWPVPAPDWPRYVRGPGAAGHAPWRGGRQDGRDHRRADSR
jgi:acetylornithine/N-succinyldiaminopimelate aminotransferase